MRDMLKDPHRYDSLIYNQRPIASKPMDKIKRAAQFAPFAALTGYDAEIEEASRLTEKEVYLDENEIDIIENKLQYIKNHINEDVSIEVTYYVSDKTLHKNSNKAGGEYLVIEGIAKKIDTYEKCIVFMNGDRVKLNSIINVEIK